MSQVTYIEGATVNGRVILVRPFDRFYRTKTKPYKLSSTLLDPENENLRCHETWCTIFQFKFICNCWKEWKLQTWVGIASLKGHSEIPEASGVYKSTSLPPFLSVTVLYLSVFPLSLAVPPWITGVPNVPKGPRTLRYRCQAIKQ